MRTETESLLFLSFGAVKLQIVVCLGLEYQQISFSNGNIQFSFISATKAEDGIKYQKVNLSELPVLSTLIDLALSIASH